MSQFLDFIHWMVIDSIFKLRDSENALFKQ